MISTSDIKKGLCIKFSNDIYKIIEFLHVKPGKGPAFVRTKLKSVTTGKVIDNTFPAGHKIDNIRVENRKYQFLYDDGSTFHFMNIDDYNQIEVQIEQIDGSKFLKEGTIVTIIVFTMVITTVNTIVFTRVSTIVITVVLTVAITSSTYHSTYFRQASGRQAGRQVVGK